MAQLSYADKTAWYGLREQPTYEQLLHTVRKPTRIPIPSRAAKWYATGIYRDFLMESANRYHDHQQSLLEYRRGQGIMPEHALNTDSTSGEDPVWGEHDGFNKSLDHEEAYSLAQHALENERRQTANTMRRQQLGSYGPTLVHPTLEAHHPDLAAQNVPHPAPIPRASMPKMKWPAKPDEFIADGQPMATEFPTFEELNRGQDKRFRHGRVNPDVNETYEQLRENYIGRR